MSLSKIMYVHEIALTFFVCCFLLFCFFPFVFTTFFDMYTITICDKSAFLCACYLRNSKVRNCVCLFPLLWQCKLCNATWSASQQNVYVCCGHCGYEKCLKCLVMAIFVVRLWQCTGYSPEVPQATMRQSCKLAFTENYQKWKKKIMIYCIATKQKKKKKEKK